MPSASHYWESRDLACRERKHVKHTSPGGVGGYASCAPRRRNGYSASRDFFRSSPHRPHPGHNKLGGGGGDHHLSCPEEPGVRRRPRDPFLPDAESLNNPMWPPRHVSSHRPIQVPTSDSMAVPVASPNFVKHHTNRMPEDGSQSITTTNTARSEPYNTKIDAFMSHRKGTPLLYPMEPTPTAEEAPPPKKKRLGWGEGLAKYEQKKEAARHMDDSLEVGHSPKVDMNYKAVDFHLGGPISPLSPISVSCGSSAGVENQTYKPNVTSLLEEPCSSGGQGIPQEG